MRRNIEKILKVWDKLHPDQVDAFIKQVNGIRQRLRYESAMSKGGTMLQVGEIPEKIFGVMAHVFGCNWMDDREIWTEFWDVFRGFRVNHKTVPVLYNERPTVKDGYHNEVRPWDPIVRQILQEK